MLREPPADSELAPRAKSGSAKFRFGGYRDVTVVSRDKYLVESYVDAQNVFGAQVRQNFVCEIEDIGNGWRVNSFFFF